KLVTETQSMRGAHAGNLKMFARTRCGNYIEFIEANDPINPTRAGNICNRANIIILRCGIFDTSDVIYCGP
ncbi:hypothetical protein OFC56_39035, partial [Escherichia coli]|nr:hypothetical protein [Escherichia coli]